jgi:hypothetical protein
VAAEPTSTAPAEPASRDPWNNPDGEGWVDLAQVSEREFAVLAPLTYTARDGTATTVPVGSTTDLASVPWPGWSLVAPYGRHTRAAVMHDHGRRAIAETDAAGEGKLPERQALDDLFLEALLDSRVPWLRAHIMWTGVSLATYRELAPARFALLVLELVAGLAWWAYVATEMAGPWWLRVAAALVPLALALLWGPMAGRVALAQAVLVVALPVFAVNLGASLVLFVPGVVIQWFVAPEVDVPVRPSVLGGV